MSALNYIIEGAHHVIAQVIKAQLIIGAVSDIAIVGFLALLRAHFCQDNAHGQAQPAVHTPHHLGVALGQVVIDRDDVYALALQGVEVSGQQGGQGLALTGAHLCNIAKVQGGTAHDLHWVVLLPQDAPSGFADGSKSIEQDVVLFFAIL